MAARLAQVDRRLDARLRRRGHGEDGFVLLESVVAISLIIVVMTAFSTFFAGGITSTNHQRATQSAVQLADSSMEQIRSLPISDLLTGHDSTSVSAQFNAAPASLLPSLRLMTQGIDPALPAPAANAGLSAKIPTGTVPQTVNNISYGVNDYLGSCSILGGATTCCPVGATDAGCNGTSPGLPYLRAVIAVTWRDSTCEAPKATCIYTTSTLLNQGSDSCFYFFQTPPAALVVIPPGIAPTPNVLKWDVGEARAVQLFAQNGSGASNLRWSITANSLPAGMALSPSGLISGSPTAVTTGSVSVKVTDACLRNSLALVISWTVYPPPTISPTNQTTQINTAVTYAVPNTCPNIPCVFTAVNLPIGLSINSSTGVISGTPTIPGTVTVTVTVTDNDGVAATASFTWSVLLPASVCVKSIALPNGSFESPVRSPGADTNWLHGNGVTPGLLWNTTEPDNNIEYWHNGANVQDANGGLPIAAEDGNQWAELNANGVGALYQDLPSVPGQVLQWSVYHRARGVNGSTNDSTDHDVMQVQIGSTLIQTPQVPTGQATPNISDGPLGWVHYTGVYTVPAGQTTTRFQFAAISTSSGDQTVGNFIDNLSLNNNIACLTNAVPDQFSTVNTAITPFSISVDRGTGPFTWGGGATLPAGLVLSTSGVVTGTPTTPGTSPVVLTFSDATAFAQTVSFNWTVLPKPTISTPTNQSTQVGAGVNLALTSSCLNSPCSYSLNNGPAGLTVTPAGVVTGTVTGSPQVFNAVTVTVTDNVGVASTTGTFTWTVFVPPAVTAPPSQTTTVGATVSLTVASTCTAAPCSFSLASAPPGLRINSSGVISGTPTSAGTYSSVNVTVTDSAANSATTPNFTWTVLAAPTITTPAAQSTSVGSAVSLTVAATCANTPCTFALANAPGGLSIDNNGVISGSASSVGTFGTVTVTVTDNAGVSATTNAFTWTVRSSSIGSLANAVWFVSNSATGASGVTYSYRYTTATTANNLSSVTMTVPAGTSGTPVAVLSGFGAANGSTFNPSNVSTTLSGNVLTVSFNQVYVYQGMAVSINVSGLTNTSTVGSYTSLIVTNGALNGGAIIALDSASAGPISFTGGSLLNPVWSVSSSATGDRPVTYSYGFSTATTARLTSVTMTVPPGTSGSPAVSVTGLPSGTMSLSGQVLTYTITGPVTVNSGTAVSVTVTSMANTNLVGAFTSQLVTNVVTGGATVQTDSASSGPISFSSGALANPVWLVSNSTAGAMAVTYSYSFTTATTANNLASVTMTVPPGTALGAGAAAAVTASTAAGGKLTLTGAKISLAGTVLTLSVDSTYVAQGSNLFITVTGMINTSAIGTYTSQLATKGALNGGAIIPLDSASSAPISFANGTLANPLWSVTNSATARASTYTYRFSTATTATLSSVTMTVPPGTAGTPAAVVTGLPAGTITLSGGVLTYNITNPTSVSAGTAVSLTVSGLTNTGVVGSYLSQITTNVTAAGASVPNDSGPGGPISFSAGTLSNPVWSASKTAAGATGVTYTYSFTTATTGNNLWSITMTVPPGTSGTPAASVPGFTGATVTLSGTLLTVSAAASQYVPAGSPVSISVTGLTNTSASGSYSSQLVTLGALSGGAIIPLDSASTAPVVIG